MSNKLRKYKFKDFKRNQKKYLENLIVDNNIEDLPNSGTEWISAGAGWIRPGSKKVIMNAVLRIGGYDLKLRMFQTKNRNDCKNHPNVFFAIPKDEIPDDLHDLIGFHYD